MRTSVAALAALLCITPARAGSGLELVSADAFGFAHIRVDALWQSGAMKDFRTVLDKAGPEAVKAFDKRFIPNPSTLSEITIALLMPPGAKEPMPIFLVTTKEPIDKQAFIKSAFGMVRKAEKLKGDFYTDAEGINGIFFVDETTFGIADDKACQVFLGDKPAKVGPMAAALKEAASKHMFIAFNPSLIPAKEVADAGPLAPLLAAKVASLSVDIQKGSVVDVKLTFADAAGAKDADDAVRGLAKMGRQAIAQSRGELERMVIGDPERKGPSSLSEMPQAAVALFGLGMMGYYDELLEKLPIKRTGNDLAMHLELPEGPYTSMVAVSSVGVGLLLPAVQKVREAAARMQDQNNLKQIGLAMFNYESAYQNFPAAAICDKKGKPLLSWRVAILPFIEQENLYKQFKLDEPWDSEHNIKLLPMMPKIYLVPNHQQPGDTKTHYQVAVGNVGKKGENLRTAFDLVKGRGIVSITDGTSNTIMVLTAADAVPWTKPEDFVCEAGKPLPKLATFFTGGGNVAFCDGSVRYLKQPIAEETLRAFLSADGGEVAELP